MKNKLSIIIVNYNTGQLTRACIKSILEQSVAWPFEIVVVDNASADESVELLRSEWPEIKIISNPTNVGLAGGVNIGLRVTTGQYRLVLNPDIVVLDGAIKTMVDYMDEHPQVGIAGGKLMSPNGRLQYSCYEFYRPLTIVYRRTWLGKTKRGSQAVRKFLMKDYDHKTAAEVDWLMGACLMVNEIALKQVGGMDERFFLYFEDVDWCRRFWLNGWKVLYLPDARFSHYHQRTSEHGGFWGLATNWVTREHIWSALKYFYKYRKQTTGRTAVSQSSYVDN